MTPRPSSTAKDRPTQRQAAAGDDSQRGTDRSAATTGRPRGHPTGRADEWRHAARPAAGRQNRGHREDRADPPPRRRRTTAAATSRTAVLATFIRCRDMTCRFPGCDEPAHHCDLDHTIAYPTGPTQASNLKCLCRKHHLLKTFGGWHDQQLPDGTVVWTSPHGQTYTTHPGSRLLFPPLCKPTAPRQSRERTAPIPAHQPRRDDAPTQEHPRREPAPARSTTNADTTKPSSTPKPKPQNETSHHRSKGGTALPPHGRHTPAGRRRPTTGAAVASAPRVAWASCTEVRADLRTAGPPR